MILEYPAGRGPMPCSNYIHQVKVSLFMTKVHQEREHRTSGRLLNVDMLTAYSLTIQRLDIDVIELACSIARRNPYNGLYGEAPPERGTFFRLEVYKRVENKRVEEKKTAAQENYCLSAIKRGFRNITKRRT